VCPSQGDELDYLLLVQRLNHGGWQGIADQRPDQARQRAHIVTVEHPLQLVKGHTRAEHPLELLLQLRRQ
jgi:hypothetical protein